MRFRTLGRFRRRLGSPIPLPPPPAFPTPRQRPRCSGGVPVHGATPLRGQHVRTGPRRCVSNSTPPPPATVLRRGAPRRRRAHPDLAPRGSPKVERIRSGGRRLGTSQSARQLVAGMAREKPACSSPDGGCRCSAKPRRQVRFLGAAEWAFSRFSVSAGFPRL
jgi:hypothetical protein